MTRSIDRSRDLSQPLDRLSADERMKDASDYLRGTIDEGLLDRITGGDNDFARTLQDVAGYAMSGASKNARYEPSSSR